MRRIKYELYDWALLNSPRGTACKPTIRCHLRVYGSGDIWREGFLRGRSFCWLHFFSWPETTYWYVFPPMVTFNFEWLKHFVLFFANNLYVLFIVLLIFRRPYNAVKSGIDFSETTFNYIFIYIFENIYKRKTNSRRIVFTHLIPSRL